MYRTLLVDDSREFRAAIRSLLEPYDELQLVAEAGDGREAVCKAAELRPDLILLDIGLPVLNGIEAAAEISAISPESRIVFLSTYRAGEFIRSAFLTGAYGYVVKEDSARELWLAMEAALERRKFVSSTVSMDADS